MAPFYRSQHQFGIEENSRTSRHEPLRRKRKKCLSSTKIDPTQCVRAAHGSDSKVFIGRAAGGGRARERERSPAADARARIFSPVSPRLSRPRKLSPVSLVYLRKFTIRRTRRKSKLSVFEVRDTWYCLIPTRYPLYLRIALGADDVGQNQESPEF
ncbi:hypothetical protein EVAR_87923_1 [Eumeta japonica]|uniref:Uncharacterized protein n=1 Tax=Eumeta variegata TaxID=151549 RepID=A0A4C1WXE2_EUMVA|nr:hypothetical protein EVAR_87923_1 [Eumeta japonica]